jgi:hypothetical protein
VCMASSVLFRPQGLVSTRADSPPPVHGWIGPSPKKGTQKLHRHVIRALYKVRVPPVQEAPVELGAAHVRTGWLTADDRLQTSSADSRHQHTRRLTCHTRSIVSVP